ncbi:universal stress protein [Streptacidiphilus monticola]|uniref:Universal stress protein n=1 Tax=Streptacidiphilus monticola TaxID=2161674 RepID=A0ABW1FTM0_9ACTN
MTRPVIAGVDGSPSSRRAALWAAEEALRRNVPLRLVFAAAWPVDTEGGVTQDLFSRRATELVAQVREEIAARHPRLELDGVVLDDAVIAALADASREAELLVLGSRGIGGFRGLLVGSVALSMAAWTEGPLALVRDAEAPTDAPLLVGVDPGRTASAVLEFAFREAELRGAGLRLVHAWSPPALWTPGPDGGAEPTAEELDARQRLLDLVRPWRERYPGVPVQSVVRPRAASAGLVTGSVARVLVEEAQRAQLVVLGRRRHRAPALLHLGRTTHAVLHHAPAPVVVVPHDPAEAQP